MASADRIVRMEDDGEGEGRSSRRVTVGAGGSAYDSGDKLVFETSSGKFPLVSLPHNMFFDSPHHVLCPGVQ